MARGLRSAVAANQGSGVTEHEILIHPWKEGYFKTIQTSSFTTTKLIVDQSNLNELPSTDTPTLAISNSLDPLPEIHSYVLDFLSNRNQARSLKRLATLLERLRKLIDILSNEQNSDIHLYLKKALIPLFVEVNFCSTIRIDFTIRSHLFYILANSVTCYEVLIDHNNENDRNDMLVLIEDSFAAFIPKASAPRLAEVTITMMTRIFGSNIVEKHAERILLCLLESLCAFTGSIRKPSSDKIVAEIPITTQEIIKAAITITSKLNLNYKSPLRLLSSDIVIESNSFQQILDDFFLVSIDLLFSSKSIVGIMKMASMLFGFLINSTSNIDKELSLKTKQTIIESSINGDFSFLSIFEQNNKNNQQSLPLLTPTKLNPLDKEYRIQFLYLFSGLMLSTDNKIFTEKILSTLYIECRKLVNDSTTTASRVLCLQCLHSYINILEERLLSKDYQPQESIDFVKNINDSVSKSLKENVYDDLLHLCIDGWEDPVDAVQNTLRELFKSLLRFMFTDPVSNKPILYKMKKSTSDNANDNLQSAGYKFAKDTIIVIKRIDKFKKVKYDLLGIMLNYIDVRKEYPDVLNDCFSVMKNAMLASRCTAFVTIYLKTYLKDIKPEDSRDWYIPSVCKAITQESHVVRRFFSEHILPSILQADSLSTKLILNQLKKSFKSSPYYQHATISILNVGKSLNYFDVNEVLTDNRKIIKEAMYQNDSNLRIDVLALLCDAKKTTQEVTDAELELVKDFLYVGFASQEPEYRQRMQASISRLLTRLFSNIYVIWREFSDLTNAIKAKKLVKDSKMEERLNLLTSRLNVKTSFYKWLINMVVCNMYPGASFQRLIAALSFIEMMIEIEEIQNKEYKLNRKHSNVTGLTSILQEDIVLSLLPIMLFNPYSNCRDKAFLILMHFPSPLPGLSSNDIDVLFNQSVEMCGKVGLNDNTAGALLLRFLFSKFCEQNILIKSNYSPDYFFKPVMNKLKYHMEIAEKDLYLCSRGFPMHGCFSALSSLVNGIDFKTLAENCDNDQFSQQINYYHITINNIIDQVQNAIKIVLDVCADESPEGYVPTTFAEMQKNFDDLAVDEGETMETEGVDNNELANITLATVDSKSNSQIILHQCFHTIKETTELLQAIVCRIPLNVKSTKNNLYSGIISIDQIEMIGKLLRYLLASARHRGAFSAVYVCFADLCKNLILCKQPELIKFVHDWLDAFLNQILSSEVSITRRSAGLPLGILAVLSATVNHDQSIMSTTMNKLFYIAGMSTRTLEGIEGEKTDKGDSALFDLPQVHAYNVIRTILLDGALIEHTRDYIGRGFILSIKGFQSDLFPIRNCASMLFSSLASKALGVKKSKDESAMINSVTGNEFFLRFPDLYPILLENLKESVNVFSDPNLKNKVSPALYPILIIISRLKPSTTDLMEGHNHTEGKSLRSFIPLINECSTNIFKVRVMASKAFVSLIPLQDAFNEARNLLLNELVLEKSINDGNYMHFVLLKAKGLILSKNPVFNNVDNCKELVVSLIQNMDIVRRLGIPVNMENVFEILATLYEVISKDAVINYKYKPKQHIDIEPKRAASVKFVDPKAKFVGVSFSVDKEDEDEDFISINDDEYCKLKPQMILISEDVDNYVAKYLSWYLRSEKDILVSKNAKDGKTESRKLLSFLPRRQAIRIKFHILIATKPQCLPSFFETIVKDNQYEVQYQSLVLLRELLNQSEFAFKPSKSKLFASSRLGLLRPNASLTNDFDKTKPVISRKIVEGTLHKLIPILIDIVEKATIIHGYKNHSPDGVKLIRTSSNISINISDDTVDYRVSRAASKMLVHLFTDSQVSVLPSVMRMRDGRRLVELGERIVHFLERSILNPLGSQSNLNNSIDEINGKIPTAHEIAISGLEHLIVLLGCITESPLINERRTQFCLRLCDPENSVAIRTAVAETCNVLACRRAMIETHKEEDEEDVEEENDDDSLNRNDEDGSNNTDDNSDHDEEDYVRSRLENRSASQIISHFRDFIIPKKNDNNTDIFSDSTSDGGSLLCALETLLDDEDDSIRCLASKVTTKYLGFRSDYILDPRVARIMLLAYMRKNVYVKIKEEDSESLIIPSDDKYKKSTRKNVLFDTEDHNTYKEKLVDFILSIACSGKVIAPVIKEENKDSICLSKIDVTINDSNSETQHQRQQSLDDVAKLLHQTSAKSIIVIDSSRDVVRKSRRSWSDLNISDIVAKISKIDNKINESNDGLIPFAPFFIKTWEPETFLKFVKLIVFSHRYSSRNGYDGLLEIDALTSVFVNKFRLHPILDELLASCNDHVSLSNNKIDQNKNNLNDVDSEISNIVTCEDIFGKGIYDVFIKLATKPMDVPLGII